LFYLLLIQFMHEFLRVFPPNFSSFFNTVSITFLGLKIVHINSIGATIILFAAYSAYGCISVFFPQNFSPSLTLSPSKLYFKNVRP